jgi:hypothetical protein
MMHERRILVEKTRKFRLLGVTQRVFTRLTRNFRGYHLCLHSISRRRVQQTLNSTSHSTRLTQFVTKMRQFEKSAAQYDYFKLETEV